MKCAECKTVADCKQAFGKYWPEKSNNGTGCEHPFSYKRPERKQPPPLRPSSISKTKPSSDMELTLQQWEDAMCRSGITVGGPDIAWMRSAMRIENTHLSVARLCGGARINGVLFLYVNPVDERTWKRVDLIVAKPLMDWARKHMDANAVSEKPKRVPLAKQQELF